jgi:acyl carrier protein
VNANGPETRAAVRSIVASRVSIGDLKDDSPLISSGLIDSMSIVDLIVDLEVRFHLKIPVSEVQPDDFDSVAKISDTLARFA